MHNLSSMSLQDLENLIDEYLEIHKDRPLISKKVRVGDWQLSSDDGISFMNDAAYDEMEKNKK